MGEQQGSEGKECPLSLNGSQAIYKCGPTCSWWNDYRKGCGVANDLTTISIRLTQLQQKYAPQGRGK